jgi:hypothetical protein
MAICNECRQEMLEAEGCTLEKFEFRDGVLPRIPFGSERRGIKMDRCDDCGVRRGGYHHPGCDLERCPRCRGQAIFCGCRDRDGSEGGPCRFPYL